ncbi:MAG TPA: hypothetical protein VNZ61_08910 [Roseomonas sp.]|nr:hypothetical protein [Roseomonas sp.]
MPQAVTTPTTFSRLTGTLARAAWAAFRFARYQGRLAGLDMAIEPGSLRRMPSYPWLEVERSGNPYGGQGFVVRMGHAVFYLDTKAPLPDLHRA